MDKITIRKRRSLTTDSGYKKMPDKVAKRLMEEVEPAAALKAISGYTTDNFEEPAMFVKNAEYNVPSLAEIILSYIKRLEGYRLRLREFHWSVKKKSEHELTNDAIGALESYEDDIAEDMQGILGIRIKIGDVVPQLPESNLSLDELLKNIVYDAVVMKETLPNAGAQGIDGIQSILDNLIHDFNKFRYLGSFS